MLMRDDLPVADEIDWLEKPAKKRGNPELLVQRAVIAFVKRCVAGGFAFHVPNETGARTGRGHLFARHRAGVVSGVPDIYAFWPGGSCWMECKADKGKLSDAQEAMLSMLRDAGQHVGVVRGVEDAEAVLRAAGAPLRTSRLAGAPA